VKNVRVAGIYTVLCFSSVRGLFLIFILSPPPHALEQKRKRKKKKRKKRLIQWGYRHAPFSLQRVLLSAIIITADWNVAGHSKYVLSVDHVDARDRVKPVKILEEKRCRLPTSKVTSEYHG